MKNTIIALVALFATSTFAFAQDEAASGAAFKFDTETLDYGTIENASDGIANSNSPTLVLSH